MKKLFFAVLCVIASLPCLHAQTRSVIGIAPPDGFVREETTAFGTYLRRLPLKPEGSKVLLYNGLEKPWQGGAYAVIDVSVGTRDLQQCADAVIRLRAEHLWHAQRYADIHFNFTSGFRADYAKWAEGYRIRVSGNQVSWYKAGEPDYGYKQFMEYLKTVFTYAGTASLSRELKPTSLKDVKIGDVFIVGGHPGHAMLVVDMARAADGRKAILVAQSYMPAQSIHIVTNRNDTRHSPWYIFDDDTTVFRFPEWTFQRDELKSFEKP